MNPLTFFPPPSRSLSRVDSRPSSAGNGAQNNGGGGSSSASSTKSVRRGMQPLSTTSSRAGSASKVQTLSSIGLSGNGQTMESSSSSSSASGATTPEKMTSEKPKRPVTSPSSPSVSSEILSPRLRAVADGYTSDPDAPKQGRQSGTNSPRRKHERVSSGNQLKRTSTNNSVSHAQSTGGRLGHRLPQGLYFDLVRANEIGHAHRLEAQSYDQDDAASLETLRYRQREAPHLFLGAFLSLPLPKVSGPLSMSGPPPRKLIGFVCGTASSAMTARAIKNHSDDEHSWLVCLWSVCVASEYRKKGLGLKLIEEYIRRLRRAEEGESKKGYECVATLCHEDTIPLFEKAAFKKLGVSHVNSGSGGWFELRRYISPKDHDEEEGEGSGGSASDKNEVRSPLSLSGFLSNPALVQPDSPDVGEEVSTTPTQELERKLQSHAVSTSSGDGKPTTLVIPQSAGGSEAEVVSSPTMLSPTVLDSSALPSNSDKEVKVTSSPQESVSNDSSSAAPALSGVSPFGDTSSFSSAKIMEALGKQQANKNREGPRNPGIAYSTIMGQTLASKTSVEDAFYALEARLVNREDQSNLADLYCPREECACLLIKGGNADWEIAEMGPLTQANLSLPNSPSPPSAPVPPPPASLDRVRSALGGHQRDSSVTSTAAHAFWIVHSPMIFENIGFSRDSEWRLPPLPTNSISSNGSEGDSSATGYGSSSSAGTERKKPVKRGSLFRGIRDTIDKTKERRNTNSSNASAAQGQKSSPKSLSPTSAGILSSSSSSATSAMGASFQSATSEASVVDGTNGSVRKVKVKYLLCADCDCGPLGYTVLPSSLEGGNFAKEVGKQAAGQFGGEGEEQPKKAPEMQLYFVAADRVRYRLPK